MIKLNNISNKIFIKIFFKYYSYYNIKLLFFYLNNSTKRKNKIIIMDDNDKTNNIELNKDNSLEISKQSAITNDDGSVTYLSQTTETKKVQE